MSNKYQCDKCLKGFKTNSGLWKHIKNKHTIVQVRIRKPRFSYELYKTDVQHRKTHSRFSYADYHNYRYRSEYTAKYNL